MFGFSGILDPLLNFTKIMTKELSEDQIRVFLGGIATLLPYGGITLLQELTGVSRNTISKGIKEIKYKFIKNDTNKSSYFFKNNKKKELINSATSKRGRPRCECSQPLLLDALKEIIKGTIYYDSYGNAFTYLTLRKICDILKDLGFIITHPTVSAKLADLGIKVQKNKFPTISNTEINFLNKNEEKRIDTIYLSNFDTIVDHFLTDEPQWAYAKFDEVVDSFLSIEEHDYFAHDTSKFAEFDQFVDYFLEDYADKFDVTEEAIIRIALFLSLLIRKNAKTERKEKRFYGGRKERKYKRVRKPGAGRYTITEKYSLIKIILLYLLDSETYGNPEKPLLWTSKSQRKLAEELKKYNIFVSHITVAKLLKEMGYSRKKNRKLEQVGKKHPQADAQMVNINNKIDLYFRMGTPEISIDCKKKELVGNYANQGSDYCITPEISLDHDFKNKNDIKISPYGIYDLNKNIGYVNVGTNKETPEFAVHSIEKWWNDVGSKYYNDASSLFITCDGGGANASISIRFKLKLQEFANKTGLMIVVSHYPPGKSKYNKIEHKLFNFISNNWRGHSLKDIQTILNYIRSTTSRKGLVVYSSVDCTVYKTGIQTKNKDLRKILLLYDEYLPQWNYTIYPECRRKEVIDKIEKQWQSIDNKKKENEKIKKDKNKKKKK